MGRSAKKPRADTGAVSFDLIYQDGSQSSNRKVPRAEIDDIDDEDVVRAYFEAQDRRIAELSGNPRGPIKSIARSTKA
jgi:hypothetical protein